MQRFGVLILCGVLLWGIPAWAVLPKALCPTLANDILVTHAAEFAPFVGGNEQAIVDAYNLAASPTFWVWKPSVDLKGIYQQKSVDGTTWNWDTYIAQAAGEKDAWGQMFLGGSANFTLDNTRAAVEVIYKAGPGATEQKAHIYAMARRAALRGEVLFHLTGAGFGNGTSATPATMGYEGRLTGEDIACALRPTP